MYKRAVWLAVPASRCHFIMKHHLNLKNATLKQERHMLPLSKHPAGCGCSRHFPGSGFGGHADETVCFCLYVSGVLRTFLCSSLPRREAFKDPRQRAFRQRWLLAPLPRGGWLQKIMADQEHFQGGQLQIGISFASSAQVWLSWILPDVSCSLNTALLRSLNSQRSLTASFGADVINLFNILPNRDTIAKQRHFISLFPSPGDNLLSVFMTKLDRYNRVARLIWFAWLDLLSKNGWQTCVHVHDRVCVFKHSF